MAEHTNQVDCGLEGGDDEPVETGRFNRWVAMAIRHHLIPMKTEVSATRIELSHHIREDEIMQAQILGGIKVIKWMLPVFAILVPAILILILYLMQKAHILS